VVLSWANLTGTPALQSGPKLQPPSFTLGLTCSHKSPSLRGDASNTHSRVTGEPSQPPHVVREGFDTFVSSDPPISLSGRLMFIHYSPK
jgi:hypothetical protein